MKTKECPTCRAILVQASTVCVSCGTQLGGSSLPPPAVPPPPWLDELSDPPTDARHGTGPSPPPSPPDQARSPDAAGWAAPGTVPPPPPPAPGAPDLTGQPSGGPGPPVGPPTYPPPTYGATGYPPPGYPVRQTHPQATTALVLGVLSIVACGIFTAIPAIVVGNRVVREVRASGGALDGEGSGRTGVVCGWVSVGFTAIGVLALVAILALGSTVDTEPTFEPVGPPPEFVPEFDSPPLTSPTVPSTAPDRAPSRGD